MRLGGAVLSWLCILVPPLVVLGVGAKILGLRTDSALAQLTPLVCAEASEWLRRPVKIDSLKPAPTVAWLADLARRPERIGTFPVVATRVELGSTAGELKISGSPWLARAERVQAMVSAPGLRGDDPSGNTMPELRVDGLDLNLVRGADGGWPIARLLPPDRRPPDPTRPPFRSRIEFQDSRITVRDYAVRTRATRTIETNWFVADNVSVDLSGTRLVLFSGTAVAKPGTPTARRLRGPVRAEGWVARGRPGISPTAPAADTGPYQISVEADRLDVAYATSYSPSLLPGSVRKGDADLVLHYMPQWNRPADSLVRARVRDLTGTLKRWPQLPLEGVGGQVQWADGRLVGTLAGRVAGVPARVDGWIDAATSRSSPRFLLRLDPMRIPTTLVRKTLPSLRLPRQLTAPTFIQTGNAVVTGSLDRPRVTTVLDTTKLAWEGFPEVASARLPVVWENQLLDCGPVDARLSGGGTVAGRMRFDSRTGIGRVDAAVRNVDLTAWKPARDLPAAWRPRGRADADLRLAFRTGLKAGVPVSGRVVGQLSRPGIGALDFDRAEFSAEVAGNRVALRRARIAGTPGFLDVTGDVESGGRMRLVARAVGIDVTALADNAGWSTAEGVLSTIAVVEGTVDAPRIRLEDFSVLGPRFGWDGREIIADSLRCERIEASKSSDSKKWVVRLATPLRLALVPAEVLVQGAFEDDGTQTRLDLTAQATQLDIEKVLPTLVAAEASWAPAWLRDDPLWQSAARELGWIPTVPDVRGRLVAASAKIAGTWSDPRLDARFDLRNARVGDVPIDSAVGNVRFEAGDWQVSGVELDSTLGTLRADARLQADGSLTGDIAINPLRLAGLTPWMADSLTLGGSVALKATLSGDRDRPVLAGTVQVADTPTVGGAPLSDFDAGNWRVEATKNDQSEWLVSGTCDRIQARFAGSKLVVDGLQGGWPDGRGSAIVDWKLDGLQPWVEELRQLPELPDQFNAILRRIATETPDDIDTAARARVRLAWQTGSREPSWSAAIDVVGENARVGPVRFPSAAATLNWSGREIDVRGVRLEGPAAIVEGNGTIALPDADDGPLGWDFRLESLSPSLELVRAFDPDFPLFGELDAVTVVAKGTSRDPRIQATAEGSGIVVKFPDRPSVVLDRLRVNARVQRSPDGDLLLAIDDGLLVRGDEQIGWDVELPIDLESRRILASRPIRRLEARALGVRMATLASFAKLPVEDVEGVLSGAIALRGTLNQPILQGDLRLANGSARFAKVGSSRRHPANDIADMALHLVANGRDVVVQEARIAFGPPEGQGNVSGGRIDLAGSVRIDNLEDFTRLFSRRETERLPPQVRGAYNLVATLAAIRPDVDNLTGLAGIRDVRGQIGLAEAARANVNGQVAISGPLLEPVVSTVAGKPLLLSDVFLRLPRPSALATARSAPPIDPRWRIQMSIPGDARVLLTDTPVVRLEFLGRGDVELAGALSSPTIVGTLAPTGGFLRYPLARLDLQRGGTARISYGNQRVGVVLSGVSAEGKITGVGTQTGRRSDSGLVNVGLGAAGTGLEATYRIEATFNGAVDLAGTSGTDLLQQVGLSAEPPLNRQQILELLGARRQFDLFASGDIEQAMLGIGRRFADTGLVSGLFRPLTSNVRSAFGLDAFDLNYRLDGTAFVRVVRRLPEPLDRFTVEFGQSFLTREQSANRLPYRVGINYELFQFQQKRWFVPRLLLGVAATNEQRDTLGFVRGTVNY